MTPLSVPVAQKDESQSLLFLLHPSRLLRCTRELRQAQPLLLPLQRRRVPCCSVVQSPHPSGNIRKAFLPHATPGTALPPSTAGCRDGFARGKAAQRTQGPDDWSPHLGRWIWEQEISCKNLRWSHLFQEGLLGVFPLFPAAASLAEDG